MELGDRELGLWWVVIDLREGPTMYCTEAVCEQRRMSGWSTEGVGGNMDEKVGIIRRFFLKRVACLSGG